MLIHHLSPTSQAALQESIKFCTHTQVQWHTSEERGAKHYWPRLDRFKAIKSVCQLLLPKLVYGAVLFYFPHIMAFRVKCDV